MIIYLGEKKIRGVWSAHDLFADSGVIYIKYIIKVSGP